MYRLYLMCPSDALGGQPVASNSIDCQKARQVSLAGGTFGTLRGARTIELT
jgi:hypothetical protein